MTTASQAFADTADKVRALAARLNRAVPGSGDRVLDAGTAALNGVLDRCSRAVADSAGSAFRADPRGNQAP